MFTTTAKYFNTNVNFRKAYIILACISLWVILSGLPSTNNYITSPFAVWNTFVANKEILLHHLADTATSVASGFALGSVLAILTTFPVLFWQAARRFFSLTAVIIYSIPLIAAAPLSALLFEARHTGMVLGCIGAYLPIFLTGLRYGDRDANSFYNMARGLGATRKTETRYIRLPFVIRGWLTGAQSAWIWAVLGGLLGDFTGSQWGLGTFLIGSLVQGNSAKVWAIVLLCLLISVSGLLILKGIGRLFILKASLDPLDITSANVPDKTLRGSVGSYALCLLVFLLLWQGLSWYAHLDGGIFAGPLDMIAFGNEIVHNTAPFSLQFIGLALGKTWILSLEGVALSVALAFLLATVQQLASLLSYPAVIIILITQVTPVVAFIPLIAFYAGRGPLSVVIIVILSTIYPSYIVFKKSFEEVSDQAVDIVRGFGANNFSVFIKARLPYAAWMLPVAIRLAIGRALLGAITAEYLLTGTGLGGLLGQTRAQLDFRIVWFICVLVALVTLLTDLLAIAARKIWQRVLPGIKVNTKISTI